MKENEKRLMSLDALRGFDMFFIMGGDAVLLALSLLFSDSFHVFCNEQLHHVAWNGFAFYDLIFPLFLFLSGVSFPFSLAKQLGMGKSKAVVSRKILYRGLMLVFLGLIYNGLLQFNFADLRYASVLGRIGSAWAIAALLYVWAGRKFSIALSVVLLLGYWLLLACVPVPGAEGLSPFSMQGSLVGYIDRMLLPGRLHNGIFDPEGLLTTLPAIVTAQLGIFTGEFVKVRGLDGYKKSFILFASAAILLLVGWLWGLAFPINKNLWTSSFVCFAGGWSLALFALFYLVIDVLRLRRWSFFFTIIGLNSITIYLLQEFVDFRRITSMIFGGVIGSVPSSYAYLASSCCYVAVCWGLLYFCYKKKIFLKV